MLTVWHTGNYCEIRLAGGKSSAKGGEGLVNSQCSGQSMLRRKCDSGDATLTRKWKNGLYSKNDRRARRLLLLRLKQKTRLGVCFRPRRSIRVRALAGLEHPISKKLCFLAGVSRTPESRLESSHGTFRFETHCGQMKASRK